MEDENKQNKALKITRKLTAKNWLFIKYYLEGEGIRGNALMAYRRAGYKGKSYSAPYELVHELKSEIEMIASQKGMNRVNLMIQTKQLIDMPLKRRTTSGIEVGITGLTPTEHIRALEFAHKITQNHDKSERALSPVNIVTTNDGKTQVNFGEEKGTKAIEKDKGEDGVDGGKGIEGEVAQA